jgi:uncharacterized damage-inducible protein DinB
MTRRQRGAAIAIALTTLATSRAIAQAPAPGIGQQCANVSCEVQNDWIRNNLMLYGLADAMPADKFGYKPTPAQQSYGERVMHVVTVDMGLLATLGGKTAPPTINAQATMKADVLAALRQHTEYGSAVLKEFTDQTLLEQVASPWFMGPKSSRQRIVYFLMMHTQDTYGQLVVYLRLNGITPPLSRQP